MKLNADNLFKDTFYDNIEDMPYSNSVDILCKGSHLYGYILLPGKEYEAPHPCVVMFHGFPGFTTNNDIEYALRRMGCAVIHVNHRGAWGSQGKYFFSNLVEDAVSIAEWARSDETVHKYSIDRENIFLAGHSMGGMTVINTIRKLKWIKGGISIAPYDLGYVFENGIENTLREMINLEGRCLKLESEDKLFENGAANSEKLSLKNAAEDIEDVNTLFVGAELDTVAPPDEMIKPLFAKLQTDRHKYVSLHTEHNLCGQRTVLAEIIGKWIKETVCG